MGVGNLRSLMVLGELRCYALTLDWMLLFVLLQGARSTLSCSCPSGLHACPKQGTWPSVGQKVLQLATVMRMRSCSALL